MNLDIILPHKDILEKIKALPINNIEDLLFNHSVEALAEFKLIAIGYESLIFKYTNYEGKPKVIKLFIDTHITRDILIGFIERINNGQHVMEVFDNLIKHDLHFMEFIYRFLQDWSKSEYFINNKTLLRQIVGAFIAEKLGFNIPSITRIFTFDGAVVAYESDFIEGKAFSLDTLPLGQVRNINDILEDNSIELDTNSGGRNAIQGNDSKLYLFDLEYKGDL